MVCFLMVLVFFLKISSILTYSFILFVWGVLGLFRVYLGGFNCFRVKMSGFLRTSKCVPSVVGAGSNVSHVASQDVK